MSTQFIILKKQRTATKSRSLLLVAFLSFWLVPSACDTERPSLPTSHTIICYLGGNNNLSSSIEAQINELQAGYKSSSTNLLVYAALPSGAKLLRFQVGAKPQVVVQYEEGKSATAQMLTQVIERCLQMAPAERYTLIVASHGSGWLPTGALQNPQLLPRKRSIIGDQDATPSEMELTDFADAIPDGMFDVIVMEACLMGGVEVAYALRDKARYLLAAPAELLDPGFTPIYRNALQTLFSADTDVRENLIAFAKQYITYINTLSGNHRSATLSVIDLQQMEPLAETFARCVGQLPTASQQQLATIQHFDRPGQYGDQPALARFFDLEDATHQLTGDFAELTHAIDRAVVWKNATPMFLPSLGGFTIEHFCGLTTYVAQKELTALNIAYRNTAWAKRINRFQ